MLVVHVHVKVKPECVEGFIKASLENAAQSIQDSTQFVLEEVYRTTEATLAHKETAHYAKWRDAVGDMMETPRFSKKFTQLS